VLAIGDVGRNRGSWLLGVPNARRVAVAVAAADEGGFRRGVSAIISTSRDDDGKSIGGLDIFTKWQQGPSCNSTPTPTPIRFQNRHV
jgi:hypothetical protein